MGITSIYMMAHEMSTVRLLRVDGKDIPAIEEDLKDLIGALRGEMHGLETVDEVLIRQGSRSTTRGTISLRTRARG